MPITRLTVFCFAILTMVSLLSACADPMESAPPVQPAVWPTSQWSSTTPEEQGVNSQALAELVDELRRNDSGIHSLLVIRHGELVLDTPFYPARADTPHDIASVTKSITTTLLGIAIKEGLIESLEQDVREVLYAKKQHQSEQSLPQLSFKSLASMRTGLDCGVSPGETELFAMLKTNNWTEFVLGLPQLHAPDTQFAYCSPGIHLISEAITAASGESALAFAKARLFEPLGIVAGIWPETDVGVNHGWGDLQLLPKDMAKLGLLYLHDGQWDGKQIVPASWVENATNSHGPIGIPGEGYGLGWWVHGGDLEGTYEANGRGGQLILVAPQFDLVVVTTGVQFDTRDLLPLLAAIVSNSPLPANEEGAAKLEAAVISAATGPEPKKVPPQPEFAATATGATYQLGPNPLGFRRATFDFSNPNRAHLILSISDKLSSELAGEVALQFGLNGRYLFSSDGLAQGNYAAMGEWRGPQAFWGRYVDPSAPTAFDVLFEFTQSGLSLHFSDRSDLFGDHLLVGTKVNRVTN